MFLLGAAGCCPPWFASTRPIDVATLAPNQNARSRCRRLDQQERRRGAWRRRRPSGGRGEERERRFGQQGEKGKPEEFSTVKLVGEERGGTGEERQGRSFSSGTVSRVWTDRQDLDQ